MVIIVFKQFLFIILRLSENMRRLSKIFNVKMTEASIFMHGLFTNGNKKNKNKA